MANLTIDQAASLGSQLTGLPVNFVKALIQEEGSYGGGNWQNGSIANNPFDVTSDWARLAGYGGNVTGQGGSQGNIASFDDPEAAVRAWAAGINSFSNYAGLRADLASGAGINVLANDLGVAGYAAGSPTFVQGIVNIFTSLGGAVSGAVGAVSAPKGQGPIAGAANSVSAIASSATASVTPDLGGLAKAVAALPGNLTAPFVQTANDLLAVGSFLGQPNLLKRGLLLAGGVIVTIIGLILFAASFIPKPQGAPIPVPIPV